MTPQNQPAGQGAELAMDVMCRPRLGEGSDEAAPACLIAAQRAEHGGYALSCPALCASWNCWIDSGWPTQPWPAGLKTTTVEILNKAGELHHFRWRVKAQGWSRLTPFRARAPADETERLLVEHLAGRARSDLA